MFRRIRWIIAAFNHHNHNRITTLNENPDIDALPVPVSPQAQTQAPFNSESGNHSKPKRAMLEALHEIAIYIHRFHNLDLFQQGYVLI